VKDSIGGPSKLGEGKAFIGLGRSNSRLTQVKKAESEFLGGFVPQESGGGFRQLKNWWSSVHFESSWGQAVELATTKQTKTP
jgi:hypothetical protein